MKSGRPIGEGFVIGGPTICDFDNHMSTYFLCFGDDE